MDEVIKQMFNLVLSEMSNELSYQSCTEIELDDNELNRKLARMVHDGNLYIYKGRVIVDLDAVVLYCKHYINRQKND